MQKLLITMLVAASMTPAYASSSVTFPITCNNNVIINETSTLKDVQGCVIDKQETSSGLFVVKFYDNNKHKYTCSFAKNKPSMKINNCTD